MIIFSGFFGNPEGRLLALCSSVARRFESPSYNLEALYGLIMPELPDDDVDSIKEGTYVYWMHQDRWVSIGFNKMLI